MILPGSIPPDRASEILESMTALFFFLKKKEWVIDRSYNIDNMSHARVTSSMDPVCYPPFHDR